MWFNRKIKPEKIKTNNTRILQSVGINVIEHLPYLEKPDFKNSKIIAKRMMVLMALFQIHLGAPNEMIHNWIFDNALLDALTAEELKFLESNYKELPEQNQTDIYWYIEAVWTFAWIGGLHDNLTFNTGVEDSLASMTPNIKNKESAKTFINSFQLRAHTEIFDMLDKFYRAHWFARNNNLSEKKSNKVDLDIITERRKALEYTCYKQYQWDEITLDT